MKELHSFAFSMKSQQFVREHWRVLGQILDFLQAACSTRKTKSSRTYCWKNYQKSLIFLHYAIQNFLTVKQGASGGEQLITRAATKITKNFNMYPTHIAKMHRDSLWKNSYFGGVVFIRGCTGTIGGLIQICHDFVRRGRPTEAVIGPA